MKTLQQKIESLEVKGWTYDENFIIATNIKKNTCIRLFVLKKDNLYRTIDRVTKTIKRAKKIRTYMEELS